MKLTILSFAVGLALATHTRAVNRRRPPTR
jgi:hypothetical protein